MYEQKTNLCLLHVSCLQIIQYTLQWDTCMQRLQKIIITNFDKLTI